ncbi:MAG: formylglycine-generating enzyme family protein, partial [Alloprevotella sp.]|nr:formylglycine-generating enzyme family protein [Alloprevotella sp.]
SYSSSPQTNPKGPSTGSDRVRRDGGWDCDATFCRVANRGYDSPSNRYEGSGVRLALSPSLK